MVAFATSPHGLGIREEQFWQLCHREHKALADVWRGSLRRTQHMFAQMMAAVHNGWMPRQDKRPWSAYEWLPDDERPPQYNQWQTQSVADQMLVARTMLMDGAERWKQMSAEQKEAMMSETKANFKVQ